MNILFIVKNKNYNKMILYFYIFIFKKIIYFNEN